MREKHWFPNVLSVRKNFQTLSAHCLDTGIRTYFFEPAMVDCCCNSSQSLCQSIHSSCESVNEKLSNFSLQAPTQSVRASSSARLCIYSERYSVEANLICCRCLSKNSHDVMTGLSHWLVGVSRGGARPSDKVRCLDDHPEDSESRGGLWDEVML